VRSLRDDLGDDRLAISGGRDEQRGQLLGVLHHVFHPFIVGGQVVPE